jgi:hypothetical protein
MERGRNKSLGASSRARVCKVGADHIVTCLADVIVGQARMTTGHTPGRGLNVRNGPPGLPGQPLLGRVHAAPGWLLAAAKNTSVGEGPGVSVNALPMGVAFGSQM